MGALRRLLLLRFYCMARFHALATGPISPDTPYDTVTLPHFRRRALTQTLRSYKLFWQL